MTTGAQERIDTVLKILDVDDDRELQEIVDLLASVCAARYASISVLRGSDYHLHVTTGLDPMVFPAEQSLCIQTMGDPGSVWTTDAGADPRFDHSPFVDGRKMSLKFYASAPIYEPGGQMVGRLCVFDEETHELTSLQERTLDALAASVTDIIELRLLRLGEPHSHQDDGVDGYAAELSHDMRAPLAAIMASLEILEDDYLQHGEGPALDLLHRAQDASRRLMSMTQGILERGSASQHEARRLSMSEVFDEVVADLQPQIASTGATVVAGRLPLVMGDHQELYSVFLNLIGNALKYTRPGVTPIVRVRSRRMHNRYRVFVMDNGPGLPEEARATVFDRYLRHTDSGEGHGLGLATVKRIVLSHGGQVGVEAAPGGGTTFWFDVPIRSGSDALPQPRSRTHDSQDIGSRTTQSSG